MSRSRYCACILCALTATLFTLLLLCAPSSAAAQEKQQTKAKKPVSFIHDVAPVLKEYCFGCHDPKKKSGKYDMTTFATLMAGGDNGASIVPGDPDESDFHYLLVTDDFRRMPPRKDKLAPVPAEKAALIAQWIKEGAKLDAGIDTKANLLRELRTRWTPELPPDSYPFPVVINALAFSPDGKSIVVGGQHELTVWSLPEGKLIKRIFTRAERAYAMGFLPDGLLVVAGGRPGQEGDLCVYDITSKPKMLGNGYVGLDGIHDPKVKRKQLLDSEDSVLCLVISADGKTIVAGGCDRTVRVWDLSKGIAQAALTQTIENHADWVLGVALSADGKYLATAARDKTAKVWNLQSRESLMTFPSHESVVYGVALQGDGSLGYSVGQDKTLRTWKPTGEGKQVKAVGGHGDEVYRIVFGPKNKLLATSSADKTVRLWDAAKFVATKTLAGLTDHVFAVAFSPDGAFVAGGSYSGEVVIWKVADGSKVASFRATPGLSVALPTKSVKK